MHGVKDESVKLENRVEMFIDCWMFCQLLTKWINEAFLYNVDKTQNNKESQEQSKETRQTKREEGIKRKTVPI